MEKVFVTNSPTSPLPARNAVAVTPSDSTVLHESRGIFVGTGGSLVVLMVGDVSPVTFTNVSSGVILPIAVTKVMAATGASDIVLLY